MTNKLGEISMALLSTVIGGQSTTPPGMAGGRWSGAPNPFGGGGAAPGMGIRDAMQGGAVSPGGGPTGGLNSGGGGGGGGPDRFGGGGNGGSGQMLLQ